jgi:hypothetical protein
VTTATNPEPVERRLPVTVASAPNGFVFPAPYLEIVLSELADLDPLFWLLERSGSVERWTEILKEQFPERRLVPFAKDGDSDDVYCFDGDDPSGNPAVLRIHSFTKAGWEYRGEWDTFDSWHARARDYHAEWLADPDDFVGELRA